MSVCCEETTMAFVIREKERQRFYGWAYFVNTGVKRERWRWTTCKTEATALRRFDQIPKKFRMANGKLKRRYTLVLLNPQQQEN